MGSHPHCEHPGLTHAGFTADVSGCNCGCACTLYLANMPEPTGSGSEYCDGSQADGCLEIDLMEANRKAFHAALHTVVGEETDFYENWQGQNNK